MNALSIIIELVELAALIVLLVYLIKLIRDREPAEHSMSKTELIDRNLTEIANFNRLTISDQDITRIWLEGREDRRLHDIDRERFSQLATENLTILVNQIHRAETFEQPSLAKTVTQRLISDLQEYPGLLAVWDTIADEVATNSLKNMVAAATTTAESTADTETAVSSSSEEATADTELETSSTSEEATADTELEASSTPAEATAAAKPVVSQESAAVESSDPEPAMEKEESDSDAPKQKIDESKPIVVAANVAQLE